MKRFGRPRLKLISAGSLAGLLAAFVSMTIAGPPAVAAASGPCDIYASASTPCVAAYSTTRALSGTYAGPLYQVKRASDGTSQDIGLLNTGGYANAAIQDTFCAGTSCVIQKIYDQSGNHNDLNPAGPGAQGAADVPASASILPVTVAGHHAYGIYMPPGVAYRVTNAIGTARGANPESMYEVASGTNVNNSCCSDFGNAETQSVDDGAGTMDAISIGILNWNHDGTPNSTYGPWVAADLEEGLFQGKTNTYAANLGNPSKFVTALLKNDGVANFAIKGGNSQSGGLTTWYSGALPSSAYTPMRLEGSITLGAGGDNSNAGTESFYEGVMLRGYSSDSADNAVQSNITQQNYQANSTGGGPGYEIVGNGGKCVDVSGDDTGGDNAPVWLWDCGEFGADQHWLGSAYGKDTLGTLGRCLDAVGGGTANGTLVQLYHCTGQAGQVWLPQSNGALLNPSSGRCLDDPSGNTANGTRLQLYDCNGSTAQRFTVTAPISGNGGKCIDAPGNGTAPNDAQLELWDCYSILGITPMDRDQQLTYQSSDGTIRTLGRCVSIQNNSTANDARVLLSTCNGQGGQQWRPQANGSLLNPQSGKCLDDPAGNTANGTYLQIWTCNNLSPQVWRLN